MAKYKNTLIALGVLVLLVLAYVFIGEGRTGNKKNWKALKQNIDKLEVNSQEIKYTLSKSSNKSGEKWFISDEKFSNQAGHLADLEKVNAMLDIIKTNRELEMISSYEEAFEKFDLDEDSKLYVVAWSAGKKIREVIIGKTSSTYSHTYVLEDKKVFQAAGNFRNDLAVSLNDLRSKQVLSFDRNLLVSIELTDETGKTHTIVEKTEKPTTPPVMASNMPAPEPQKTWVDEQGKKLNETEMSEIANTLSALMASSFTDESTQTLDSMKKARVYKIKTTGAEYLLNIYPSKGEEDLVVTVPGSLTGYKIAAYTGKRLIKSWKELLAK